jgi:hypothetical protein
MNRLAKKEFCIIGVENIKGLKDDVISMSTGLHRIIEANNMLVITFEAYMTPDEMKMIIEETKDRTYFLFELNPKSSAVKIKRTEVNDYLFGSMSSINPLDIISTKFGSMGINSVDDKFRKNSEELYSKIYKNEGRISEILAAIKNRTQNNSSGYSEEELSAFTKEEQDKLLDQLLDKAPNLTEEDKKILNFLVNKNN